ncbi:flavodoxin-like domain-containing protein [Pseudomonas putida]|uniref:Flavodoxin-like domain-containing protein n=1 Tax=Pseudomonas putida TaxID=303 RepID=A0A7D5ZXD7_PSEPU|nr:flavodoxin family protein [Pseudomonas putida]QLJ12579.1 flavodoxin-like domain-containing protein [Pseudomonas putida]
MSSYKILFGTESGNAEVIADDIVDALSTKGLQAVAIPMDEYAVDDLSPGERYVFITSTYGEGELPETTQPFFEALNGLESLAGVEFFAFGLGDSTYTNYNRAIHVLIDSLQDLGAKLIGTIGKHDGNSGVSLSSAAHTWISQSF